MYVKWLVIPVVVLIAGCSAPVVRASTPVFLSGAPTSSLIPLSPTALPMEAKPAPSPLAAMPAATVEPPVAQAINELAARLGVGWEEIIVFSVEYVEWPDASLGCPQPGMMYAQVITPGYRVTLCVAAGGACYEYHTDRGAHAVLCEQKARAGATTAPTADPADPAARRAAELARADLAQRLNLTADEITVVKIETAPWSDAWPGCMPPPGKQPDQAYPDEPPARPGYRLILEARGVRYEYRSDGRRVFFCGIWQEG